MKKLLIIIAVSFLGLVSTVQAQKVIKVKGDKIYFKKSGYVVKPGEELNVMDGGSNTGVIQVIKAKRNLAIGKIVSGSIKKGNDVELLRKSRRSSERSSEKKSSRAKMYGYAGLGFHLLGEIELDDGKIDFNNHMVLPVGIEIFLSKRLSGTIELIYAFSGGANPTNLTGADEWDTSYMEFNGGLTYYFSKKFYGRGSLGYTSINISGTNIGDPNPANNGAYDFDISGLNFGFGGGFKLDFGKSMYFKADAGYKYTTLTSATLQYPTVTDEGNPDLTQGSFTLMFLTGLKF